MLHRLSLDIAGCLVCPFWKAMQTTCRKFVRLEAQAIVKLDHADDCNRICAGIARTSRSRWSTNSKPSQISTLIIQLRAQGESVAVLLPRKRSGDRSRSIKLTGRSPPIQFKTNSVAIIHCGDFSLNEFVSKPKSIILLDSFTLGIRNSITSG